MRIIEVKVKPNARVSELQPSENGPWSARLKSPPVDGRANAELIELIARHLGCPKSAVAIATGASGRLKRVRVAE